MSEKFPELVSNLYSELFKKEYDWEYVVVLLEGLNNLPFKCEVFVDADSASRICKLCKKIKEDKTTCILISGLLTKIALTQNQYDVILELDWHYSYIRKCCGNLPYEFFYDLNSILKNNSNASVKYGKLIVDREEWFQQCIRSPSLMSTLAFIKFIIRVTDNNVFILNRNHTKAIIDCLMARSRRTEVVSDYSMLILNGLNLLSRLFLKCPDLMHDFIPELIGICYFFSHYGLNKLEDKPEKIMPTQQIIVPTITRNQKSGKKQKLRKAVNKTSDPEELIDHKPTSSYEPCSKNYLNTLLLNVKSTIPSDSEVSDFENTPENRMAIINNRIRKTACNLLLIVFKNLESKDVFGYWMVFLPSCPNAEKWTSDETCTRTLAYCVAFEPEPANREAALKAVLEMLTKCRHYLSHAEMSKKVTSAFIPFSETVAYSIMCLHKILSDMLESEMSFGLVISALKCCAVLVQATPYHKMQAGLITEIIIPARKFMYYKDVRLQVGALIVIGCFLSIDPKVDEIYTLIESDSSTVKKESTFLRINARDDNEISDFEEGYSSDDECYLYVKKPIATKSVVKSWILNKCFMNLGFTYKGEEVVKCKPAGIKVILESLQVLSAITFHHFDYLLLAHINLLTDIMCDMLNSDNQEIVLQAAKTVSIIGDALAKLEAAQKSTQSQQWVNFWQKTLTPLSRVLQSIENPMAKALACDCIANIGEKSFKELPRNQQILCCALLVGLCSDEDVGVRGAAVRALAMVVMYRTLREDICFVTDCGENIMRALQTQIPILRAKAAWAFGNYTDALVLNFNDTEIENIEDDLFLKLILSSFVYASDDDSKIKTSIPRALGNLLRLVTVEKLIHIEQLNDILPQALKSLGDYTSNTKNMKVLWNVCHAMGNAMKNDALYSFNDTLAQSIRSYFTKLVPLSQTCSNFKVRINAVVALRSPRTRENYGGYYWDVWSGLLVALQNAASVPYDTEFRHKNNLIEQIFVTLAHLTCLLTPADESKGILTNYAENLKFLANTLYKLLPPEKESCIKMLEAAKHLLKLPPTEEVLILKEVFICELDSCVVPSNAGLIDA